MFGTIRRHQKWLWIVISTVTIVSFVVFFSPNRRRQAGWTHPRDYVGSINGHPVTVEEYLAAQREAEIGHLFNYGEWPSRDTIAREVNGRLFLIDKIRDLNIQVGEPVIAQWIKDNPAFADRSDKQFRLENYEQFVTKVLGEHGISQADFERFARHEVAIQHLAALAGTAGKLVTPQEAEELFRYQSEEAQAEAVFISSSNYLAQVTVDPAAVATYYTNQQARYRIPEKITVSYVKFAGSNYWADAGQRLAKETNLNQVIEAQYLQQGTNAFKDTNNMPLSPEAAKQQIRTELRDRLALDSAEKKAVDFLNELAEMKDKTNALDRLAAAKGLVSQVTPPFGTFETPSGMQVPQAFTQAAAKLTPDEPVAEEPITADDAVYVIALKSQIPSRIPPLDSIRDQVTQDYKNSKALDLARAAGQELYIAVTNGLAQGKSFQAVVADKNASATLLPPFSRKSSNVPGIPGDASQLVSTAFSLAPGKASSFVPTFSGGFLVYLKALEPVSDAKMKADLPDFTKKLRQNREFEAFDDWYRKQMEAARVNLPGDNRQQRASAN